MLLGYPLLEIGQIKCSGWAGIPLWKKFSWATALTLLPDVDIALDLLFKNGPIIFHRGFTHSVLFALITALIVWLLGRSRWPFFPRLRYLSVFSVIFSHDLADFLFGNSQVALFWPLQNYNLKRAEACGLQDVLLPELVSIIIVVAFIVSINFLWKYRRVRSNGRESA